MRTIVFIHGLAASKEMWNPLLPYLWDFDIINYELPGHGESAQTRFTWDDVISDLTSILFGKEGIIYVLHSFAAAYLPELIPVLATNDRVVLVEGVIHIDDAHWTKSFDLNAEKMSHRWIENFRSGRQVILRSQLVNKHSKDQIESWSHGYAQVTSDALLFHIGNFVERLKSQDIINSMCGAASSICFVRGEKSKLSKANQNIVKSYGIEVYNIQCSAHFPMLDNPLSLSQVIKKIAKEMPTC